MDMNIVDLFTVNFKEQPYESDLHNVLQSITKKVTPKRYLEVGVWKGESLEVVLKNVKEKIKNITLVDNWNDIYGGEYFKDFSHIEPLLYKYENSFEVVDIIQNNSHVILPELIKQNKSFDMITVDGDHSYNGAWVDLIDAWQLLEDHGLLLFDDLYLRGHEWLKFCFNEFFKKVKHEAFILHITENNYISEGTGVIVKIEKDDK